MTEVLRLAVAIQGVNNFSGAFSKATSQIGGIHGAVVGLGAGLAAAGPAIAFFAAGAAASFAKASIEIAASFEREMLKVQAVTQATGEEYQQLTAFAENLGATTEFTATQAAEAMAIFGRAGFEVNEVYEVTPIALSLATAGMTDMATSAAILSNVLRGYSMETTEAGRVADVLTLTANSTFTSLETLTQSFKMATPIAAAAGIQFEELSAAIGVLGNMGLQGTMSGTGLRQALSKLLDPSTDATKTMARLGVELQVLTDVGNSARDALELQLPSYEALQSEQTTLQTTTRDLGFQMSGIGIEMATNNIEITNHKSAIEVIKTDYVAWSDSINTLKADLLGLKDVMAGFSLSMKKNNLEIMEIRQQADREGRELFENEEARIKQIQEANDELAIDRERTSIKQIELQNQIASEEAKKSTAIASATSVELGAISSLESANTDLMSQRDLLTLQTQETSLASQLLGVDLAAQKTSIDTLTSTVAEQVTGTESFVSILTQLQDAGATTADFMEIFSIRGGSAMLALRNAGVESLQDLTTELLNSQGTLDETAGIIRSGMTQEIKLMESAWQGLQITIGTAFFPVLSELIEMFRGIIPAIQNILSILPKILEAFSPIIEVFVNFIDEIGDLTPMMSGFGAVAESVVSVIIAFAPILDVVVGIFETMGETIESSFVLYEALIPIVETFVDIIVSLGPAIEAIMVVQSSLTLMWAKMIEVVSVLLPTVSKIASILGEVLAVAIIALLPLFDVMVIVVDEMSPIFEALVEVVDAFIPIIEALAPIIGDLVVVAVEVLTVVLLALTPLFPIIADLILGLVPIIEILAIIIVGLTPLIQILTIGLGGLAPVFEDLAPLIGAMVTILVVLLSPISLVSLAIEGITIVISWLYDAISPLLPSLSEIGTIMKDTAGDAIQSYITIFNLLKDVFFTVKDTIVDTLQPAFTAFGEALGDVYDTYIQPIIDAFSLVIEKATEVKDAITGAFGGVGDAVGGVVSTIGSVVGFQTGTGPEGAPGTGLYELHNEEIVLNPKESDMMRAIIEGGGISKAPQTAVTYSIGNIEIHANSESEGRAAVRSVLAEMESLKRRGDKDVI